MQKGLERKGHLVYNTPYVINTGSAEGLSKYFGRRPLMKCLPCVRRGKSEEIPAGGGFVLQNGYKIIDVHNHIFPGKMHA